MRVVTAALTIAAAPVIALSIMLFGGFIPLMPAVITIAASLIPAAIFGLLWVRDLDVLTATVQEIETGSLAGTAAARLESTLMEPLGIEIARLSRRLASNAARTERERQADALIIARLPDPVVVLRDDLTISRQNPAAETVFGADLPALLRHPALRTAFDQALARHVTTTADLAIAGPVARESRATVVSLAPPSPDGGRILVVLSDRTRERSIERSHADFVANVSHELRTPLASLIGFTETLLGPAEDDPPARKRFLKIMAEQGARMNRLIDDLLSLSRIETVEHQAPQDVVDLGTLLPRIVAGYEPKLAGSGARILVAIAADTPPVVGDADQIAQVAQNLLDNAVKYGRDQGTVRLSLNPSPGGEPWPMRPGVVLAVKDDGLGIPKAALPRITERFYRVDKGRSRAAGGTGLGLAIVKHIVIRHRGQLAIESEEGEGTTVSVWLPVPQPALAVQG